MPIRVLAQRLNLSIGAVIKARDKFIEEGSIEIVKIPGHTKPTKGLRVINYLSYQNPKKVPYSEQSRGEKVPYSEQSRGEKVPYSEQSVSYSEQSRAYGEAIQIITNNNNKEVVEDRDTENFEKFVEKLKLEYPDIDVDLEVRKFKDYNYDTKRELKSPRLALRNWLDKAIKIKNRDNGSGNNKKRPRPVKSHEEYLSPEEWAELGI